MQKTARRCVVVKGVINGVGGHHRCQWQIAASNAFRQAQKIRCDAGLLVGKEGAAAAKSDHDFIGDEVHLEACAQGARQTQIFGVMHGHAGRTLHQRLDDQRGGFMVMLFKMGFERARATPRKVAR